MSRSRFSEQFTAALGGSPGTYVRDLRMAEATHLLRDGSRSLAETAASLGYSDVTAFSRAYSNATGCPPSRVSSKLGRALPRDEKGS